MKDTQNAAPGYADQTEATVIALGADWRAEILHSWNLGSEVRKQWEQFAHNYGDRGLFLSPGWFETWWGVFGKTGHLFIVTLYAGDKLKGIFPCWIESDGVLSGMANELYFDFLLDSSDQDGILDRFLEVLARSGHARARFPTMSHHCGNGAALLESLRRAHFPFWKWVESYGPKVDVSCPRWEDLEGTFQSKLLNNLKKGRRRAEQQGSLLFEEVRNRESLEKILDEAFAVEGSGWKASKGTAINQSAEKSEWYRSISLWAAKQGVLRMYLLRLNGRLIAFDLGLESGQTVFALKTGYDEHIATRFSAGNLMRCEVLKSLWSRPEIDRYDFLGETFPWKLEWTSFTDEVSSVFVYPRTLRGWAQYMLKYGWKQPVKKVMRLMMSNDRKSDSRH